MASRPCSKLGQASRESEVPGGSGEAGAKLPEERSAPRPAPELGFPHVGFLLVPISRGSGARAGSIVQRALREGVSPRPSASGVRGWAAPSALAEPAAALLCVSAQFTPRAEAA